MFDSRSRRLTTRKSIFGKVKIRRLKKSNSIVQVVYVINHKKVNGREVDDKKVKKNSNVQDKKVDKNKVELENPNVQNLKRKN